MKYIILQNFKTWVNIYINSYIVFNNDKAGEQQQTENNTIDWPVNSYNLQALGHKKRNNRKTSYKQQKNNKLQFNNQLG